MRSSGGSGGYCVSVSDIFLLECGRPLRTEIVAPQMPVIHSDVRFQVPCRKRACRIRLYAAMVGNADEDFRGCSFCSVCVRLPGRAEGCVAAIARPYTGSDMARYRAGFKSCTSAGVCRNHETGFTGCGEPMDCHIQCLSANDDGLFAKRKEHGRGGRRLPRRRLSDSRDRS